MHGLNAAEIHLLISELSEKINGSFIRKFYQVGEGAFRITFYKDGKNTSVYCKLLESFNETSFAENAGAPTQFAMGVRKRIENAKVQEISQRGGDRIIILKISSHGVIYSLIIEMFGKGNMVLLNADGITELCYASVSFKDRVVQPHKKYSYPEDAAPGIWSMNGEELRSAAVNIIGAKKPMAELSKKISAGPIYLEDAFLRAGMDPKESVIDASHAEKLSTELINLSKSLKSPSPRLYGEENKLLDYSAIPLKKYEASESTEFDSMGLMMDRAVSEGRLKVDDSSTARKKAEMEASIAKQEELVSAMKEESENSKVYANKIFSRMNELNALISYLRENRRATVAEASEMFPSILIKEIDLKNKSVTVEL